MKRELRDDQYRVESEQYHPGFSYAILLFHYYEWLYNGLKQFPHPSWIENNHPMQNKQPTQPFWQDEPDYQAQFPVQVPAHISRLITFMKFYAYFVEYFLLVVFMVVFYRTPTLSLFFGGLIIYSIVMQIILKRRKKKNVQTVDQVQQRARELAGADTIGSAVHVAGHPLLKRDQNVVLALVSTDLVIYAYDANPEQPLARIPMSQIKAVHTVVYDDDRIPHIEVIDSAAQAIQLTFLNHGEDMNCLFRSMKKLKPIDWYHAIQTARNHFISGNL